jgi:hypothetical protein
MQDVRHYLAENTIPDLDREGDIREKQNGYIPVLKRCKSVQKAALQTSLR